MENCNYRRIEQLTWKDVSAKFHKLGLHSCFIAESRTLKISTKSELRNLSPSIFTHKHMHTYKNKYPIWSIHIYILHIYIYSYMVMPLEHTCTRKQAHTIQCILSTYTKNQVPDSKLNLKCYSGFSAESLAEEWYQRYMYIYIHVYTQVYICIHIHTYVCMYIHIYINVGISIFIYRLHLWLRCDIYTLLAEQW